MKYNKILILVTTIFLIIAMNTVCFADNADKNVITDDFTLSGHSSINDVIYYSAFLNKNNENINLTIKAADYNLPTNLFNYNDDIRLKITYSPDVDEDYKVLDCKVINYKTDEIIEDLSEENIERLFNIEYGKDIIKKDWVDVIKLSELKENEIYKYTANSTVQFPEIENDTKKNCLLYINGRLDDYYKKEINMYKKISGSLSISYNQYSPGESFRIMYKVIENEELLKLIPKDEIIFLSNYNDGDNLEYQFEKYIYNDTERNITIHTRNIGLITEKSDSTIIEKNKIYGFNWMIDYASISFSNNINTDNEEHGGKQENDTTNTNTDKNKYENLAKETNQLLENYLSHINSHTNTNNSISKLPQTGNFFNAQDGLFFLILICTTGIIVLILPNAKYKNINK